MTGPYIVAVANELLPLSVHMVAKLKQLSKVTSWAFKGRALLGIHHHGEVFPWSDYFWEGFGIEGRRWQTCGVDDGDVVTAAMSSGARGRGGKERVRL